jgi:hypothetical protein
MLYKDKIEQRLLKCFLTEILGEFEWDFEVKLRTMSLIGTIKLDRRDFNVPCAEPVQLDRSLRRISTLDETSDS